MSTKKAIPFEGEWLCNFYSIKSRATLSPSRSKTTAHHHATHRQHHEGTHHGSIWSVMEDVVTHV